MYLHVDEPAQKVMSDGEKINTDASGDIKYKYCTFIFLN